MKPILVIVVAILVAMAQSRSLLPSQQCQHVLHNETFANVPEKEMTLTLPALTSFHGAMTVSNNVATVRHHRHGHLLLASCPISKANKRVPRGLAHPTRVAALSAFGTVRPRAHAHWCLFTLIVLVLSYVAVTTLISRRFRQSLWLLIFTRRSFFFSASASSRPHRPILLVLCLVVVSRYSLICLCVLIAPSGVCFTFVFCILLTSLLFAFSFPQPSLDSPSSRVS